MSIPVEQILVNRCYLTRDGVVRRVTALPPTGGVTFRAYEGRRDISDDEENADEESLELEAFAQDAVKEVPCPEE